MPKRPSLLRIILIDYVAFLAAAFPLVMSAMGIVFLASRSPGAARFAPYAAAITAAGLLVLVWRVRLFYAIFDDGLEALATISDVSFFRDRGMVHYVYTHQGRKYMAGNAVLRTRRTRALVIGSQVIVLVDRNNPKRAFIRHLYV